MRIHVRNLILIALCALAFQACDTASNIDDPRQSHLIKFYGSEGIQRGVDLVVNPDGTLILFGTTESQNNGIQLYLVKTDAAGNMLWETTFGGPLNEAAKDLELTNDGRIVILANAENSPGETDILLMTLTADGAKIDSTLVGFSNASGPTIEEAVSVSQTLDGFVVAGSTSNVDIKTDTGPADDQKDALHLRFFDDLTMYDNSWKTAHGPGSIDSGVKIIQISPTRFYFFGYTNSVIPGLTPDDIRTDFNFWVTELGSDGEILSNLYPGSPSEDEILSSVIRSPLQSGEGFLLTGTSSNASGSNDIYSVKLRNTFSFTDNDYIFQKTLSLNLSSVDDTKTSSYASSSSGFLISSNEKTTGVQNMLLTKINNDGGLQWLTPAIFGGEQDDHIGAVAELPDGKIVLIGTMAIGADGESKMVLIKVNKDGKFLE